MLTDLDDPYSEKVDTSDTPTDGIAWAGFERKLYGKYRLGKAQADLESCKRPEPEPEPDLGIEPDPEPA